MSETVGDSYLNKCRKTFHLCFAYTFLKHIANSWSMYLQSSTPSDVQNGFGLTYKGRGGGGGAFSKKFKLGSIGIRSKILMSPLGKIYRHRVVFI